MRANVDTRVLRLADVFAEHLEHPVGRGQTDLPHRGTAGGAICGDLIQIAIRLEGDRVADAGFEASGCGAASAAGSAAVHLVRGEPLLNAARIGMRAISDELGGLSPGKLHAADLAADALHQALGAAARADAALAASEHRTLVAMSGGVDSAVAALLLAREGRDVAAVTLELWRDPDNDAEASCCSASAVRAARAVAHQLGLPHFTLDLRDEFRAGVVQPWLDDHARGLTPNPCVRCNGHVRLDAMVGFADRVGARDLATGHYARLTPDGLLQAAADPAKDQTYMLAATAPATLRRLRFPLGELTKPQVRAVAADAGLPVASKAESQDLCFLAGTGRVAFLAKHGAQHDAPGDLLDSDGNRIGTHPGHRHFTVGQRKGLRLGLPEPVYVLAKDGVTNTVTVGRREELATTEVPVRHLVLHRPADEVEAVKLRYRTRPLRCRLDGETIHLEEPVDGAAPGQAAVFLRGDAVVGSATIA